MINRVQPALLSSGGKHESGLSKLCTPVLRDQCHSTSATSYIMSGWLPAVLGLAVTCHFSKCMSLTAVTTRPCLARALHRVVQSQQLPSQTTECLPLCSTASCQIKQLRKRLHAVTHGMNTEQIYSTHWCAHPSMCQQLAKTLGSATNQNQLVIQHIGYNRSTVVCASPGQITMDCMGKHMPCCGALLVQQHAKASPRSMAEL
jgi:hypothetical protein